MPWFKLFYHIVWTTWQRQPFIVPGNSRAIYHSIRETAEKQGGILFALNGMEDHVHLVTTIPATKAVSEFVRQVKGASSYTASHLPNFDPVFQWQSENAILTISEAHLEMIINYVDHQQEHHAAGTLHTKLEHFALDVPKRE